MSDRKFSAQKSGDVASTPWRIPVAADDVADTGQHFDLVADQTVRDAVAKLAGLRELPRLEASFDVARRGGGLHVAGHVSGTVGQNCVVTLEPLTSEIEEAINLYFVPQRPARPEVDETEKQPRDAAWNAPEPLIGGVVDLGAIATEFLILALDPYPRKPGAVFDAPKEGDIPAGPFAALGKLTKGQNN